MVNILFFNLFKPFVSLSTNYFYQALSMLRKSFYKIFILITICVQVSGFYSCTKEYSYEGGLAIDTIPAPIHDTIPKPVNNFPSCPACSSVNTSDTLFWSFKYNAALLCGSVTNSVITPERNGFTFFGPSKCSLDTGLVMTVFLDPVALDMDKLNINSTNVALEYYDNTTLSDIFISNRHLLSFTIDSYVHGKGIAKGSFEGNVKLKDGTLKPITDGKFTIHFK